MANGHFLNRHLLGNCIHMTQDAQKHSPINTDITNADIAATTKTTKSASSASGNNHDMMISDDMISDDMEMPYDSEEDSFGDLDDMDAWLEQQKRQLQPKEPKEDIPNINTQTEKKQKVVRFASEDKPNDLFNHGNGTNSDGTDDWLQALLSDDNHQQKHPHIAPDADDLSNLMAEYGVDTEYEQALNNDDVLDKINERLAANPKAQPTMGKPLLTQLIWGVGCLLLIALMWVQYLIFNVDRLMTNPDYANKIQGLCSALSCSLPSTDLSQLNIQSGFRPSSVNTTAQHSDVLIGLENQANNELIYPNVKVSLSNGEQLLGQFIATPQDYLTIAQKRMGAKQSKVIMFTVPIPASGVGEVQVEPFY